MNITNMTPTSNNPFQQMVFQGLLELFLNTTSTTITFVFSLLQTLIQAALLSATGTGGLFGS